MIELDLELRKKFKDYLEQRELMPLSIKVYLEYFDKFIMEGEIKQEAVNTFLNRNNSSVARGFLKNFLRFMSLNRREFNISDSELLLIKEIELPEIKRKRKKGDINYISFEQVKKINMAIPNPLHRLLFAINFFGALRLNELLSIKYSDFELEDWARNGKKTKLKLKVYGKGGKYRFVFIPCGVAHALDKYFMTNGKRLKKIKGDDGKEKIIELPVFNVNRRTWERLVKDYGKKYADVDIHVHGLRHSFATYLLKRGWSLIKIKKYLGHSDIQTTQIYAHLDIEDIDKDYDDLGF